MSDASASVTIQNVRGLHARAAAKFCDCASQFEATIRVMKDGLSASGCSLMALLMLGADRGSTVEVTATGPDAQAAVDAICALISEKFGEPA